MKNKIKKQGFTLVELLVAIAIILVLAFVLTMTMRNISESAKKANNVANLRQLWATVLMYASDNQGRLPPNKGYSSGTWQHHVVRSQEHLSLVETSLLFQDPKKVEASGFLKIFNSPLNKTRGDMAFGSGGWPSATSTTEVFGRALASIDDPGRSIALLPYFSDTKTLIGGNWQRPGSSIEDITFDKKGLAACVFVDGSVSEINRDALTRKRYIHTYPQVNQPE